MERYLRRGKLGSVLDDLGLRTVIALAAWCWFSWLWGIGVPSLLAGLALGVLGQMTLTRYRRHTVSRREEALRRALGGEMLLEEMMLAPARQAHLRSAMLLAQRYPLVIESVSDEGAQCRYDGKLLLVTCIRRAPESEAAAEDALQAQRACRRILADRVILCLTCRDGGSLNAFAERSAVPIRIIRRETMLRLAGQASPATDEQLIALGKRKKRPGSGSVLWATVLHRDRAGRYMFYGTAMLLIYILTGIRWYPLPGMLLLCLGACSRYGAKRAEPL